MGLTRDLSTLTKGEASCLLAALRARNVIRAEMRRMRQKHAHRRSRVPTSAQMAGLRMRLDDASAPLNLRTEQALVSRGYLAPSGEVTDAGRALIT
jgi:hypothetical protein